MTNFTKRAISGFLFVVILTACIFIHPLLFASLFFIINLIALIEFSQMARRLSLSINSPLYLLSGSVLFIAGFLDNYVNYRDGYLFFALTAFLLSITELYRAKQHAFQNIAFSFYGILYITLSLVLLVYLPYIRTGHWQPEIVFYPFLLVWINDTFAYLFGSRFGKHRLFPRISPKKSWEGAIGGGVSTILVGILLSTFITNLTIVDTIVISLIVVVFGIFGDLIESMFKRCIEIKDSGKIIPGHGGLLDRIDSVIFVIPPIFVYLEFVY